MPTSSPTGADVTAPSHPAGDADRQRILLLDVDGTLVDYQTRLPASAEDAVRRAIAHGHRIYLCTGRAKAEINPPLWDLGVHGLIGGNGSYVESDGEVLRHQVLDPDLVSRAVGWLLARHVPFYIECNSGLFGTDDLPVAIAGLFEGGATEANIQRVHDGLHGAVYGQVADAPADAAWRTDANKISFVLGDGLDLDALAAEIEGAAKFDVWSLTGKRPEFGEVGQLGIHKGDAVELLAQHLGVPTADMIAFGDARSDLELLITCGTGVAMGQAPDELKDVATFVTKAVDDDGLAHAFRHLGLI